MASVPVRVADAKPNGAISDDAPLKSLLLLDKSGLPFVEQLGEACRMLKLDIPGLSYATSAFEFSADAYDLQGSIQSPRYEWTLKWILNKLSVDIDPKSPCLEPQSWVLLRYLLFLVKPAKVAQILKGKKYLGIVRRTLAWLRAKVRGYVARRLESDTESTSDSETVSKKRKRKWFLKSETIELACVSFDVMSQLILPICETLRLAQFLMQDHSLSGITVAQLKIALRCEPTEAANIVSDAIYLLEHVCRVDFISNSSRRADRWTETVPLSYMETYADFWGLQFSGTREVDGPNYQAFAECCLQPALLLLQTYQGDFSKVVRDVSAESKMKDFIATNIVYPLQNISSVTISGLSANLDKILTERLFSSRPFLSIRRDEHHLTSKEKRRLTNDEIHLKPKLVGSLFEIAITHNWAKSRPERDIFLQGLFDEVQRSIATQLGPNATDSGPVSYFKALKALLDLAVANVVPLSAASVESIMSQVLDRVGEAEDQQIDWEIISLCLTNDGLVFLNSKSAASSSSSQWKANDQLKKLLAKLDASNKKSETSKPDEFYSLKLNGVLIPLIRAFAILRKLSAFFELWNIKLTESASLSMWEDDAVLSTVQEMIVPYLSGEEINTILGSIDSILARLGPSYEKSITASNLVMLDCVVGARYSEDTRSRLSNRVLSVYSTLATILLASPSKYSGLRWRIWRILTRINQTWIPDTFVPSIPSIDQHLVKKVVETTDAPGSNDFDDNVVSFREQSFAFGFMASSYSFERTSPESADEFKTNFNKSVNRILDSKASLCRQIDEDLSFVPGSMKGHRTWSGKSDDISSHDGLYMSCIARLLSQPHAVAYIESHTQERMLNQLTLLARHEMYFISSYDSCASHSSGPVVDDPPDSIDASSSVSDVTYSWLWDCAQRCNTIDEQKSFAEVLRHCQCTNFTRLLNGDRPLDWDRSSEERTFALGSLLEVPASQISPNDKIEIANGILEDLRRGKRWLRGSIDDYLQLLVKVADVPRKFAKSMKVFQITRMDEDNDQHERSAVFILAEVVCLYAVAETKLACHNALCDLTRIVLKYIYDTLTTEDASARYFTAFYQWIGAELERADTETPVCSEKWPEDGPMLLVSMTALNFYLENRQQALKMLDTGDRLIENIRQLHFQRILELCIGESYSYKKLFDRIQLAAILECLYGYLDLFLKHPRMLQVHECLLETVTQGEDDWPPYEHEEIMTHGQLRALYFRISYKMPIFRSPDAVTSKLVPWRSLESGYTGHDRPREPHVFRDYVSSLECEALDKIMPEMTVDYQRHVILGLTDAQKTGLQRRITEDFLTICDMVKGLQERKVDNVTSHFIKIAAIRYLNVVLSKCPKLISQYMIENLLSTITSTALKPEGPSSFDRPSEILLGLGNLFGTTLAFHRAKLWGRYHLVVPFLQAFMRRFFIPYSEARPSQIFHDAHASFYARLLTILCDPSPSAVAHRGPRQQFNLNDETKKAREIAGQHLQYLVMTYCECRISGKFINEGIKEALELGLWAVIRCLNDDVRRTMNAALEPNSRAIWKKLYEDWKNFGEWHAGQSS